MTHTIANVLRVDIVRDRPTVLAFFNWQEVQKIYSLRGSSCSGPDFFTGFFDPEHGAAIQAFFDGRGGAS